MAEKVHHQPSEWLKGNLIGSGSFGRVHLAIDNATGALFVVKSATSPVGLSSLKNEASILENLDSPYIVSCVGKDVKESFSLFYEYMPGGSLANIVQNFGGSLNENLIRFYTKSILQGLKYLHKNKIVHCDIKCTNVLVSTTGAVKLADFGCATRVNDQRHQTCGGTPLWMAPEVLRNERLDFAADIWSLGCTIIEMATGRPPWGGDEGSNPMAMMLNIANGNAIPEFPKNMSPEGLDFLAKCLDRDPRKRWTARRLLSHPFMAGKATYAAASRSPSSVLDTSVYDSDSDDENDDFAKRIQSFNGNGSSPAIDKKFGRNHGFDSEEDWITVRS